MDLGAACGPTTPAPTGPARTTLTVFAAASLQPAFDKVGQKLQGTNNIVTTFSYAGTQTLTTQLTQGAPADVFASADVAHMTTIESGGLIRGQSVVFAHNRLEIAVAKGNPKGIHTLADLARSGLVVGLADPPVPPSTHATQRLGKRRRGRWNPGRGGSAVLPCCLGRPGYSRAVEPGVRRARRSDHNDRPRPLHLLLADRNRDCARPRHPARDDPGSHARDFEECPPRAHDAADGAAASRR